MKRHGPYFIQKALFQKMKFWFGSVYVLKTSGIVYTAHKRGAIILHGHLAITIHGLSAANHTACMAAHEPLAPRSASHEPLAFERFALCLECITDGVLRHLERQKSGVYITERRGICNRKGYITSPFRTVIVWCAPLHSHTRHRPG